MKLTDLIPNIFELIPYAYEQMGAAEYEEIIQKFLNHAPVSAQPTLIHMLGIPGAGKSTYYHSRDWAPHVLVDFDMIMAAIPAYQQDTQTLGAVESFRRWEIPARVIGYELLRRAVTESKDIFFDHGGLNNSHLYLLQNLKNAGYKIEIHHVVCGIEEAIARAQEREKVTLRHTPRDLIEKRYQLLPGLVDKYKNVADAFYAHDNSAKQTKAA